MFFIGSCRMFNRNDDPFFDFVRVNFNSLAQILFGMPITLAVIQFVTSFYKNQVMYTLKEKITVEEELGKILFNLDQSIILAMLIRLDNKLLIRSNCNFCKLLKIKSIHKILKTKIFKKKELQLNKISFKLKFLCFKKTWLSKIMMILKIYNKINNKMKIKANFFH